MRETALNQFSDSFKADRDFRARVALARGLANAFLSPSPTLALEVFRSKDPLFIEVLLLFVSQIKQI